MTDSDIHSREGSGFTRRLAIVLLTIVALAATVLAMPSLNARQGGVPTQDYEYNCGGSCHNKLSSAVVAMSASNTTPAPSAQVTVTVEVSGGQAEQILGVEVVSTLSPVPESIPTNAGWVIVSDPSGSTSYNYNEIDNYASSKSFVWTMTAPQTPGIYTLFARVMHGGGGQAYAVDFSSGISFVVGSTGTTTGPSVLITSPTQGSTLSGEITVSASIPSTSPIAYALLKVDGILQDNKTAGPFTWSINTALFSDGQHVINITAVDTDGRTASRQIAIQIDNGAVNELLLNWVWTMAAGTLAIVSVVSLCIVVVLLIRRRMMKKVG